MPNSLLIGIAGLIGCLMSLHAQANTVVCVDDAPPYVILDNESENITGITISLLKQAFELNENNYSEFYGSVVFTPQPFVRCLEGLKSGEYDAIPFVIQKPDTRPYLNYTEALFSSPAHFYRLADTSQSSFSFTHYSELHGLSLGVIKSISYGDEVDEEIANNRFHIYTASTRQTLLELVLAKRLDLIVGNRDFIHYQLDKMGKPNALQQSQNITHVSTYHIGISRHSLLNIHLNRINNKIDKLKRNGAVEALKRQLVPKITAN